MMRTIILKSGIVKKATTCQCKSTFVQANFN